MSKNRLKKIIFLLSALVTLACTVHAFSEPAKNVAGKDTVIVSENKNKRHDMFTDDYFSYWSGSPDASVTVNAPEGKKLQGLYLSFFRNVPEVSVFDAETGVQIARYSDPFENAWIPFSSPCSAVCFSASDGQSMQISRLCALTEGDVPAWVQQWHVLDGSADLMLVSTHADDELLWFGGMLPTYAGEQKKKVIVVYMCAGQTPGRKNELLDGLWHCGVRDYPDIGSLPDNRSMQVRDELEHWGEKTALNRVCAAMRKYRPRVVAAQDIAGEYGNPLHIITTDAVLQAVLSGGLNETVDPESFAVYGGWQPDKLYVHLYRENEVIFDWSVPLQAFGGKNGKKIAAEAFKMHASQQKGRYSVRDYGQYDCRKFGLYFSKVGPDEEKNDLFEHIN